MNFNEWRPCWKWITSTAAVISALAVIAGGVTWAADTRYQTLEAQKAYVEEVAANDRASEIRQLKRDIERLRLKIKNGNASPEDEAMIQYLRQDLSDLQTQ